MICPRTSTELAYEHLKGNKYVPGVMQTRICLHIMSHSFVTEAHESMHKSTNCRTKLAVLVELQAPQLTTPHWCYQLDIHPVELDSMMRPGQKKRRPSEVR